MRKNPQKFLNEKLKFIIWEKRIHHQNQCMWAVALRCTRLHTNFNHTELRRHFVGTFNWSKNLWKVMLFCIIADLHISIIPFDSISVPYADKLLLLDVVLWSVCCVSFISIHSVVSFQRSHEAKTKQGILFKQGVGFCFCFFSGAKKKQTAVTNKQVAERKQSFAVCSPVCFLPEQKHSA